MQLTKTIHLILLNTVLVFTQACMEVDRSFGFPNTETVDSPQEPQETPKKPSGPQDFPPLNEPVPLPEDLEAQALAILNKNCLGCHNSQKAEGGISDLSSAQALISSGLASVEDPLHSKLMKVIDSGRMPPGGNRLIDDDIGMLSKWLDSFRAPTVERDFYAESELFKAVATDLETIETAERPHMRYLSLHVPYNEGRPDSELIIYRKGIDKLINSLSRQQQIHKSKKIKALAPVYRIDLRAMGWGRDLWQRLSASYPYQNIEQWGPFFASIQKDTEAVLPLLRAEWFLVHASTAPFYYRALQSPFLEKSFASQLSVDFAENIKNRSVLRAGFRNSGVTTMDRVIERHPIASTNRFLWRSYEFTSRGFQRDILRAPLGPHLESQQPQQNQQAFTHDGGEFIYPLANGMLGYFVVNRSGQRIDQAPAVQIRNQRLEMHISRTCMSCHKAGLIKRSDQLLELIDLSPFSAAQVADIQALYSDQKTLFDQIDQDNDGYLKALSSIGISIRDPEPVNFALRHYQDSIIWERAHAELGLEHKLTDQKWLDILHLSKVLRPGNPTVATHPQIQSQLGRLGISRKSFEELYPQIIEEVFQDEQSN